MEDFLKGFTLQRNAMMIKTNKYQNSSGIIATNVISLWIISIEYPPFYIYLILEYNINDKKSTVKLFQSLQLRCTKFNTL